MVLMVFSGLYWYGQTEGGFGVQMRRAEGVVHAQLKKVAGSDKFSAASPEAVAKGSWQGRTPGESTKKFSDAATSAYSCFKTQIGFFQGVHLCPCGCRAASQSLLSKSIHCVRPCLPLYPQAGSEQ